MRTQVTAGKDSAIRTVKTLNAALPYIQKFNDTIIVIKYGGNTMTNVAAVASFCQNIVLLSEVGLQVVIVHGGGPQINKRLINFKIESRFMEGLRFTDAKTLSVVQMVLLGEVNPQLVSLLLKNGAQAVGINGVDGRLLSVKKLLQYSKETKSTVDLGFVGDLVQVNGNLLHTLLADGYIPVIAPIGVDAEGQTYNVNADTVTSRVAASLAAQKVIFMTDAAGVMDKNQKLITGLTSQEIESLLDTNVIYGGMRPKVRAALSAVQNGVKAAHIIDGRLEHALLLELLTDEGVGTLITQ